MTNRVACPDPLLFSQFLDHELEAVEESQIIDHLKFCLDCQAQVGSMRQSNEIARAQLFSEVRRPRVLPEPSSLCPPLEKIAAYMQGGITTNEDQQLEQHLHGCEACFHDAKEAARVLVSLASPQSLTVPAALKARVAAQWESSSTQKPLSALPRLVIQLTEQGLRLIASHLVAPLLSVEEVFVPQVAYRSSALNLRLQAGEHTLAVFAIPDDAGVAVTLTLLDREKEALANQRIFLRQQGRAIFSAQTDQQGALHVPRLEPGEYEVSCHEIQTTFLLELRP